MPLYLDPALGALGGVIEPRKTFLSGHCVRLHNAYCITGTNDSGNVVWLVNPLHKNGEIRLPAGGNGLNSGFPFWRHGPYRMRFPKQTDKA